MKNIGKAMLVLAATVLVSTVAYSAAIHLAVIQDDLANVKAILAKTPAQVNAVDEEQLTALHYAANYGRLEIAAYLLERGAKVNAVDADGCTALHLAMRHPDLKMVKLLLDKGANVNARDTNGATPLHLAVAQNQLEIVKLLLEKGADPKLVAAQVGIYLNAVEMAYLVSLDGDDKILKLFAARGLSVAPARLPELKTYAAKSRQQEAKVNLGAIYVCEVSFFGERNTFGDTFDLINWGPVGQNRYAYFLPGQAIPAKIPGPYYLPTGIKPVASDTAFLAVAVTNLDDDPTLDVWTVNDHKELFNVVNDVVK